MKCFVCENKKLKKVHDNYYLCEKCNAATSIVAEKHYDETYYYGGEKRTPEVIDRAKILLKYVKNYLDVKINILDFGCNTGSVVSEFNQNKFSCDGVDINERDLNIARATDKYNYYLPGNVSSKYGCVTAFDVIEHFNDFDDFFINGIDSYLLQNGILIITTPNLDSNWKSILKYWHGWSIPEYHRTILSRQSIGYLSSKYNYSIVEIKELPIMNTREWKYYLNGKLNNRKKITKLLYFPFVMIEYFFYKVFKKLNNDTLLVVLKNSA